MRVVSSRNEAHPRPARLPRSVIGVGVPPAFGTARGSSGLPYAFGSLGKRGDLPLKALKPTTLLHVLGIDAVGVGSVGCRYVHTVIDVCPAEPTSPRQAGRHEGDVSSIRRSRSCSARSHATGHAEWRLAAIRKVQPSDDDGTRRGRRGDVVELTDVGLAIDSDCRGVGRHAPRTQQPGAGHDDRRYLRRTSPQLRTAGMR